MWLGGGCINIAYVAQCNEKSLPVQDPRSRVVGDESNSDSVSRVASADDVTDGRVLEVVVAGTSAPDDVEGVL